MKQIFMPFGGGSRSKYPGKLSPTAKLYSYLGQKLSLHWNASCLDGNVACDSPLLPDFPTSTSIGQARDGSRRYEGTNVSFSFSQRTSLLSRSMIQRRYFRTLYETNRKYVLHTVIYLHLVNERQENFKFQFCCHGSRAAYGTRSPTLHMM
jgi:hypothetical protein